MNRIDHDPNFQQFKTGVRLLTLVRRRKDTGESNKSIRTLISRNPEEFDAALDKLREDMEPGLRIYGTIDARDEKKAAYEFQRRQLGAQLERDPFNFYHEAHKQWVRCLAIPSSRVTKNFLFDYDMEDFPATLDSRLMEALGENLIARYRTPNGAHFITRPFNASRILGDFRKIMRQNAMLLWDSRAR